MSLKFEKIDYTQLNARQKENYNFHKVASALAEYGYDSIRLNNDWEGNDYAARLTKGNKKVLVAFSPSAKIVGIITTFK